MATAPTGDREGNSDRQNHARALAPPLNSQGDVDTAFQLRRWIAQYSKNGRPIKVNFRRAVPWIRLGDRATHYIHPYPGKLLPQIAYFFANASTLSKHGDSVLDSFGGTGTVGLEAILAGRNAVLFDANPLATLIARVKTRPLSRRQLSSGRKRLKSRLRSRKLAVLPSVVNLKHWYTPSAIRSLREILLAVESERSKEVREFLLVCFSVLVRKVSLCDPRLTVPVRRKEQTKSIHALKKNSAKQKRSARQLFLEIVDQNAERIKELTKLRSEHVRARVIHGDARKILNVPRTDPQDDSRIASESVQLIISSPPYGGAQKYVRASSLSLGWLRLTRADELRALEDQSIGREHFHKSKYVKLNQTGITAVDRVLQTIAKTNALRACISGTYISEMREACQQMAQALRPGGYLVLVIGNNLVTRVPFLASKYLARILRDCGLELKLRLIDDIKSRGLMTKRNKTAGVISREWVLLFRKPNGCAYA
jgi:DNA modification methylase